MPRSVSGIGGPGHSPKEQPPIPKERDKLSEKVNSTTRPTSPPAELAPKPPFKARPRPLASTKVEQTLRPFLPPIPESLKTIRKQFAQEDALFKALLDVQAFWKGKSAERSADPMIQTLSNTIATLLDCSLYCRALFEGFELSMQDRALPPETIIEALAEYYRGPEFQKYAQAADDLALLHEEYLNKQSDIILESIPILPILEGIKNHPIAMQELEQSFIQEGTTLPQSVLAPLIHAQLAPLEEKNASSKKYLQQLDQVLADIKGGSTPHLEEYYTVQNRLFVLPLSPSTLSKAIAQYRARKKIEELEREYRRGTETGIRRHTKIEPGPEWRKRFAENFSSRPTGAITALKEYINFGIRIAGDETPPEPPPPRIPERRKKGHNNISTFY